YGQEQRVDRSLRIVTEHGRTAAFLIADGVLPSNEGRGYILRRLLRRSVRHLRLLGVEDPALARVGQQVVDNLGEAWPELVAQRSLIEQVVASEEESFSRTLRQGSTLLEGAIRRTRDQGQATLAGETAFQLHAPSGFHYELTLEAAAEAGLDVDADRFRQLMDDQRRRAKEGRRERDADLPRRASCPELPAPRHPPPPPASPPPGPPPPATAGPPSSATRPPPPRAASWGCCATARSCPPPARATRASWSWTGPRSTP